MVPMELHLRNANQLNKKYLMIFVMPAATPNEAVRTVYRRYSIIIDSHFPNFVRRTFSILAELLKSRFTPELPNWQDLWQLEPATTLTNDELKFGEELLEKLGIPKGAQYVCLGVKEAAYYASITPDRGYGQDLRHEASDSKNVNIENYMAAATYLTQKGIYVVRVGSVVGAPLPTERHPMIIDYATTHRSELGDITLGVNCKFFICGCTGSCFFAANRNRPIAYADHYFERDFMSATIRLDQLPNSILLTRMYLRKDKTFVSFREMIRANKALLTDQALQDLELSPIPNGQEEILDLVSEMNLRLDNTFVTSSKNEELQNKFYDCFYPPINWQRYTLMQVSNSFLRKYQDLL
jgi:putative glycosyltransferase (TIGR04372 family)